MAKKKAASRKTKAAPDFEKALDEIEQIIDGVESGEIGLEQSLDQYEKGMALIRHCRGILERAEQKIERLNLEADGSLSEEPSDA